MALGTETLISAVQTTKGAGRDLRRNRTPMGMETHLLVEMWQSPFATLADARIIERVLGRAGYDATEPPATGGSDVRVHQFSPYGVSGTARSPHAHILIHTWPENEYAAVDIYSCGRDSAYQVLEQMKNDLEPGFVQVTELRRGQLMEMEDT